jgi:hypothetical protein
MPYHVNVKSMSRSVIHESTAAIGNCDPQRLQFGFQSGGHSGLMEVELPRPQSA